MLVHTLPIPSPLTLTAEPLTPTAFAPFGAVLANPAPETRPSAPASALPPGYGAVSANQGTAIQYRALAPPLRNLYAQAPSRKPASPRTTMFVCGARQLVPDERSGAGLFEVKILERHPFTTQTFIPLGASGVETRYLVIVAPSRAPDTPDKDFPTPTGEGLPGRGLPDLGGLRAFVATGAQAVTYGAGTWHAPMVALGPAGSAIDFVVVQFANDEAVEDCQEVALRVGEGKGDVSRIMVQVPPSKLRSSKL
ncbi:ureidoglycolate hydrolase [Annulohypoxylon maeteangense]|uniref:ureidoglycolate hydrolase n=1 Tax=Annulohypoxylon maeteangense TaxID=1927788 RepID=UPI00200728FB|nr:ureidoglycolate hydrolase [Annulohypoxylon maeteangense]KAI0885481.1 ureidoglycolate hydrolase [Annulohypoxylon maeteangense]